MANQLNSVTLKAIESFRNTKNVRLKSIMSSLVTHLHAFAAETHLSEAEWLDAIKFLTNTGQACTEHRQEFILLSDVLGLSMLIVELKKNNSSELTESTVLGPFYVEKSPEYSSGDDISNGATGKPCLVSGCILNSDGTPIFGAKIEVWQADDQGKYDVQKTDLEHPQARGTLCSDANGKYQFKTIVAEPYPIPTDGPVGQLLMATNRSPWRPAHLHFKIQARGYETLVTHLFRKGDPYIFADPVFGFRESLETEWHRQPDGVVSINYDFILKCEN